jgi:hypothetical protein
MKHKNSKHKLNNFFFMIFKEKKDERVKEGYQGGHQEAKTLKFLWESDSLSIILSAK